MTPGASARPCRSCVTPMVFAALFAFTLAALPLALPVRANNEPLPHTTATDLVMDQSYKELMLLYGNIGLAGVFLLFLLWSLKRQDSIETIDKRYAESAEAHLAAFKEISTNSTEAFKQINDRNTAVLRELCEDYRAIAKESRDIGYVISGSNERIVTMLEGMERREGLKG